MCNEKVASLVSFINATITNYQHVYTFRMRNRLRFGSIFCCKHPTDDNDHCKQLSTINQQSAVGAVVNIAQKRQKLFKQRDTLKSRMMINGLKTSPVIGQASLDIHTCG